MPPESSAHRVSTPSQIRKATLERHADELARWAMQREKNVALLDLGGARQARLLAEELRALGASDLAGPSSSAVNDAIARARALMAPLDAAPPKWARRGVIASTTHTRSSADFKRVLEAPAAPAARPPARPRLRTTLVSVGVAPRTRTPSEIELAYRDTVPAMEALRASEEPPTPED